MSGKGTAEGDLSGKGSAEGGKANEGEGVAGMTTGSGVQGLAALLPDKQLKPLRRWSDIDYHTQKTSRGVVESRTHAGPRVPCHPSEDGWTTPALKAPAEVEFR